MELVRPETAEAAAAALGNGSVALAGGTEVVPLMRGGLLTADTLVELKDVVPRGIDGTRIGAGTTLAELEVDPQVAQALRDLLQATRCWYWRLDFPCYLHGGDRCHARAGEHSEHAIFGNERCASAHPSDPAAALLALGATIRTTKRELPLGKLYRLPTDDDRDVTALDPDELILELDVPQPDASTYLKARRRREFAFALVGVAAVRTGDALRFGLAGVAPIPWLLDADGLEQATPLPGTAYKVDIARALLRRAAEAIA